MMMMMAELDDRMRWLVCMVTSGQHVVISMPAKAAVPCCIKGILICGILDCGKTFDAV
jgi:hypothetical protein